jgi:hypothetical protein
MSPKLLRCSLGLAVLAALLVPLAALAATAPPVESPPPVSLDTFYCVVDLPTNDDDCGVFGPVDVSFPADPPGTHVAIAEVELDRLQVWKTFVLRVEVCDGNDWIVHIGDSPSNNGGGGDAGDTDHDAEVQLFDRTVTLFRSGVGAPAALTPCQFEVPAATGCVVQDWIVREDELVFDSNAHASNPLAFCAVPYLFEFPPYDEADGEDPGGWWSASLFVGLNRVYDATSYAANRYGTGVTQACLFLSSSTAPSSSEVDQACGF